MTLHSGFNYVFGPGNFTLNATVELQSGEVVCIKGSAVASKPSVLLSPYDKSSCNLASHFRLLGGRLELNDITVTQPLSSCYYLKTQMAAALLSGEAMAQAALRW